MFVLRRFILFVLIFSAFTLICLDSYSLDHTVRTVYFMPVDSDDRSDWLDLDTIMKNAQLLYKNELDRHGFPDKTFRLETDQNNRVIVHKINGIYNKLHYRSNTMNSVIDEIRNKFDNDERNIYIVVMAGMDLVESGISAGIASAKPGGWSVQARDHGYALSAETTRGDVEQVIIHELGHTFGLWHIVLYDRSDQIMGGYGKLLSLHEARWLSKNHYFNDRFNFSFAPSISNFHKPEALNNNLIQFRIDVSDPQGLHQAYIFKNSDILGWDYIEGVNDSATFDIDRWLVSGSDQYIWVQIMDNDGNWVWHRMHYELPDQQEFEDGRKHLTIRNKNDINALIPLNSENEWCGWENAGIYEKMHGGSTPDLPNWYVDFPKMDDWTHWFYSHAKSRFVYDVSHAEYNRFESYFYMPNPCNDQASVKIICFADNIQIYESEVL